MKWKKKRLNYLIDKSFQLRLLFMTLISLVVFTIFVGWQVFYAMWPIIVREAPTFRIEIIRADFLLRLLHFSVPVLLVIGVLVIIFSHRIVGPIYRVKRALDDLIAGKDVQEIRFRENDEFQSLVPRINKVIQLVKELRASNSKSHRSVL
ncbi:MAG: hypothetical protein JRE23_05440 [Deltaproteobacteria bacterium]|nr:hypothetical protein [Deltaproteobacteria bacterium]